MMTTEVQIPPFRAIPENSRDAELLYEALIEMPIDGVMLYKELSDLIGRNVQTVARGALDKARRRALKQNAIVIEVCRNVGVKRLSSPGILTVANKARIAISRVGRRTVGKLSCADFESYNTEQKLEHNAYLASFGSIALFTGKSGLKRIMQHTQPHSGQLPIGKTLELFRG